MQDATNVRRASRPPLVYYKPPLASQ